MLDMIKYIKNINDELSNYNVSFTEIIIANKVIDYCKNNDIELTDQILKKIIWDIYEIYNNDNEVDRYDDIINNYFKL